MAKGFASTILILGAYCLAGRLGLLLAVPPNYPTAVWPASGIALAAVLLLGYRACPGVFLGALAINSWIGVREAATTGDVTAAVLVSASIGLGATLQAVVGKLLIERAIGYPNPLVRERDIVGFLALGGPVACLVSSTWGLLTLTVAGGFETAHIAMNWWTWWVGDVIGVIIFAPLVLIFFAQPRDVWRPRRLSVALPLCVAFTVATVGYVYTQLSENTQARLTFERHVAHVYHDMHEHVIGHLDAVHSLKSYFASTEHIRREEFTTFNRHVLSRHAGVQALEWVPRVPHQERDQYEARAREDDLAGFVFRERNEAGQLVEAGERDEYYPVFYVEPRATNEAAIGFDVASDPDRRAALELARDTGQLVATEPVTLVQETADQAGFLVFEPVYAKGLPTSNVAERRQALEGYVLGVFRVGDIVHTTLQGRSHQDYVLQIEDVTAVAENRVIYSEDDDRTPAKKNEFALVFSQDLSWSPTLEVATRQWRFDFRPTAEFFATQTYRHTWLILAAGLSFTGLLGTFLLILAGRTLRVEELVTERTWELSKTNEELGLEIEHRKQVQDALCLAHENLERRVQERTAALKASESRYSDLYNNAPDMFVSVDIATQRVIECNRTFLEVTGFSKAEIIDRHVYDLYHPDCMEETRRSFRQFLSTGRTQDLELLLLKADGEVVDVSLNVSAVRDTEGQLLYSRAVLRDITAKKQAEARIKNQEVELAHVSRLSTMGEMAAGLAHEINQPLAAIAAYAEGAAMRIRGDNIDKKRLAEVVESISSDARRAGEVVHRLRQFVDKRAPERSQVNINGLIIDAVEFVATDTRRRGAAIRLELEEGLPAIQADSIAIQQVLLNLIRNGCDAMDETNPALRHLLIRTRSGQGDSIEVEVQDRGHGLSPEMKEQVFEPFFTSKKNGLGMGLAISRSIIESHGGRIWATSNSDGGATFHFSLTVAEGVWSDE